MRASRAIALLGLAATLSPLALVCGGGQALGGELGPGRHRRIPCKGAPEYTYDVYLPAAYGADAKARFPVLFLSTPWDGSSFYGMERWAERNACLLVCVNDTSNGQTMSQWDAAQSAVMKAVEADLRVHSCLRFSMGLSGGGMASMRLASRYNDKFAGVCMLAMGGAGREGGLAKHIAVAFVHGEKDTIVGVEYARWSYDALKSRGNPVRIHVGDWGHTNGPLDVRERFMDWMLDLARLTHPKLPLAERRAAAVEVRKRIEALAGVTDAAERLRKASALFEVPGIEQWPDAKKLRSAWFSAKYDLASAEEDLVERHEALTDLWQDERARACPAGEKRRLKYQLRRMRRESPCKEEWKARQIYDRVAAFEKQTNRTKSKLIQAARSYQAVSKRYRDTKAGRRAADAARRIVDEINR